VKVTEVWSLVEESLVDLRGSSIFSLF